MRFFSRATGLSFCILVFLAGLGCSEKPKVQSAPTVPERVATKPQTKSLPGMPPPNPAVEHIPGSVIGADGSPPGAASAKP